MDRTTDPHECTRMKKTVELEQIDWGQIIDGLICRAEQYELTAQYYDAGFADGDILEVSSTEEAHAIAKHYRELSEEIQHQVFVKNE